MTTAQAVLAILVMAAVTFLTRALPFLLFGRGEKIPPVVLYLGKYLPPAVIAMLIVYCLKSVPFGTMADGAKQLIAAAAVVALHLWKKNTLLSIGAGTALYMLLIRL